MKFILLSLGLFLSIGARAARSDAAIESDLREKAILSMNLNPEVLFRLDSLSFSFGSMLKSDQSRQAEAIVKKIKSNSDVSFAERLKWYEKLIELLRSMDDPRSEEYLQERERWLKRKHEMAPDDLDVAMAYVGVLPDIMTYRRRRICREFADKFPQRAEPLVLLADIEMEPFLKQGLAMKDGRWSGLALTFALMLKKDPERAIRIGANLKSKYAASVLRAVEIIDQALKREPEHALAKSRKLLFVYFYSVVHEVSEFQAGADIEPFRNKMIGQLEDVIRFHGDRFPDNALVRARPLVMDLIRQMQKLMLNGNKDFVFEDLAVAGNKWKGKAELLEKITASLRELELTGADPETRATGLFWAGLVQLLGGDRNEAHRLFEASLKEHPYEAIALYAYDRSKHGESERAAKFLEALLKRHDSATVRAFLAKLWFEAGKLDRAKGLAEWFERERPEQNTLATIIAAASSLRHGEAAEKVSPILNPLVKLVPGDAKGASALPKHQQKNIILNAMICRALERNWETYGNLKTWCETRIPHDQGFLDIDKLATELRGN